MTALSSSVDQLLETVDLSDSGDRDRIRKAVFDLYEHIAKEENGLFPASLTTLDGDEWDDATPPGSRHTRTGA